jgi:hypothetical protein
MEVERSFSSGKGVWLGARRLGDQKLVLGLTNQLHDGGGEELLIRYICCVVWEICVVMGGLNFDPLA